jgi:hypothetical protein
MDRAPVVTCRHRGRALAGDCRRRVGRSARSRRLDDKPAGHGRDRLLVDSSCATPRLRLARGRPPCRPGSQEGRFARVEALVVPDNVASQRVLEKAGFRREGKLRSYLVFEHGRADALIYLAPSGTTSRNAANADGYGSPVGDDLDFSLLPVALQPLAPLIARYAESDDVERSRLLENASDEELRGLSEAPSAHWDTINAFLDENLRAEPGPRQDVALALDSFSQAAMEAKLDLERRRNSSG